MPTIGIDYTPAVEQGGGIGRYVRELVTALALEDTRTTYRLFAAGTPPDGLPQLPGENFSWKYTRLSSAWLARLWYRARISLPVEYFVGKVDIYHATDFVLPPTLSRTRTLLTVHDLSFVRVPDAASPRLKAYLDHVVPQSAKSADHILADSQATKDDLVKVYGLESTKISVLLSGVAEHFVKIDDVRVLMTTRRRYEIGDSPYIFSIGTIQPRKNYGRLIQALARLRNAGYDINLVIAGGKGWLADPIFETIRHLKLQNHVKFIGFADDADLPALYSAAHCCAFPSLYEGFGLPILEAMACGTPVVTSNVSSLPEVAGDAALQVDPYNVDELAEAVEQLLKNHSLYQALVQKGYQRIKLFQWQDSARQLQRIYTELLS